MRESRKVAVSYAGRSREEPARVGMACGRGDACDERTPGEVGERDGERPARERCEVGEVVRRVRDEAENRPERRDGEDGRPLVRQDDEEEEPRDEDDVERDGGSPAHVRCEQVTELATVHVLRDQTQPYGVD